MRCPNVRLHVLLQEAGWSGAALASEVNLVGAESGVVLRYDRSAVAHWLAGMRPRAPVPLFVAEALSRRLGRRVSVTDTGWAGADGAGEHEPVGELGDAVDELRELSSGPRRRQVLVGAYSLAALVWPGWDEAMAASGGMRSDEGSRVGREDVTAARRILEACSRLDALSGGGSVRVVLAQYLVSPMGGWLRGKATPAVRRELFEVAAALAYLCAFAHFDDGQQERAQRYYAVSLRLAREAGDRRAYALALRGLSVQAHYLGHASEALKLAQGALDSAGTGLPGQSRAFLHGQLAVAAAAAGERQQAVLELGRAEDALGRAQGGGGAVGVYHPASLARQRAAVAVSSGASAVAGSALRLSVRWRPAGEQRSRALDLARLGELELRGGCLEAACGAWASFLDLYPRLDCARADDALRALLSRTLPHQRSPQVISLREQAACLAVARRQAQ